MVRCGLQKDTRKDLFLKRKKAEEKVTMFDFGIDCRLKDKTDIRLNGAFQGFIGFTFLFEADIPITTQVMNMKNVQFKVQSFRNIMTDVAILSCLRPKEAFLKGRPQILQFSEPLPPLLSVFVQNSKTLLSPQLRTSFTESD